MKILVQALFLLGLALFALGQRLHAETSLYGTQPVTPDGGNTWRTRSSSATSGAVLLSTRAAVATQGTSGAVIGMYRYRQIVNLSTNSVLSITPSPCISYTVFCTSCGVLISSRTANAPGLTTADNRYVVPHQADVCGQWDPATTAGLSGMGASIDETFEK